MGCRLATIGRYRRERRANKETSDMQRQTDRRDLAERVGELRGQNIAALCRVAESINQNAEDIHQFLADRRDGRAEQRNTMFRELGDHRARIQADMDRIVSTDFI